MVRATLSKAKKATNKSNKNDNHNKNDTTATFSNLALKVPNFKKIANKSPFHQFKSPLLASDEIFKNESWKEAAKKFGLTKLNQMIKEAQNQTTYSFKTRNGSSSNHSLRSLSLNVTPNHTKWKSKLLGRHIDVDEDKHLLSSTVKPKNQKKAKRAQRRKQLQQQIETNTTWKFLNDDDDDDVNVDIKEDQDKNDKNDDNCSLMNVESLMSSIKDTEKEIISERKIKANSNNKRQIEADKNNLTALFKNDEFDSDPLKYTNQMLKQRANALNLKSDQELKKEEMAFIGMNRNGKHFKNGKGLNGKQFKKHGNKNYNKLQKNGLKDGVNNSNINKIKKNNKNVNKNNKRNGHKKISDGELTKQISKQLALMKQHNNINKKKLKLSSNVRCFKKMTKSKNGKKGKFIEKKFKQKMTQFAKANQKKRKWRI